MTERVLTIRQPWADLIMAGVKDVENRTWEVPSTLPPWYRCECGRRERGADGVTLVRHYHPRRARWQGMAPDGPFPFRLWVHASLRAEPQDHWSWGPWLGTAGDDARGALLGQVTVTGCHHADDIHAEVGQFDGWCSTWAEPDAWHWTLTDPQPLEAPIPLPGRLGLWTLPDEIHGALDDAPPPQVATATPGTTARQTTAEGR